MPILPTLPSFGSLLTGRVTRLATISTLVACSITSAWAAPRIGVFPRVSGGSANSYLGQYDTWLNRKTDYMIQFNRYERFAGAETSLTGTNYWLNQVDSYSQDVKNRMVISVGMLPDTNEGTTSLATGATGAYDVHWETFADKLIARGMGSTMIRLGWEHNGSWYRWSSIGKTQAFKDYWIRIVNAMRSRPGANFKFCWNPVVGDPNGHGDPLASYPGTGNQYVDYVGLDMYDTSVSYYKNRFMKKSDGVTYYPSYNEHFISMAATPPVALLTAAQIQTCRLNAWNSSQSWIPYDLDWWSAQVKTSTSKVYNMPLCFPEWGLDNIINPGEWDDGSGGRDNTYFISKFYNWVSDPNNRVDWVAYFEAGNGSAERNSMIYFATQYPLSKAHFPTKFGTLVRDDFEDGNSTGWTTTPSGQWSVITDSGDKALKYDFNWNSPPTTTSGTARIGDPAWTNTSTKVDFKVTDMAAWGDCRFWSRYTDGSNHYYLQIQNTGTARKMYLYKKVGGVSTTLASNITVAVNANTWHTLDFNVYAGFITVKIDNVTKISVTDSSPLTTGNVVLGGYQHDILFDNIHILP